ncbi:MAG: hypothetical protein RL264_2285 [Bacteroidota bacterium]|jgi:hypothetical protein
MIVYAPSYAGLVESLRNYRWDELEVITNNDKIEEFCLKTAIKCSNLKITKATNRTTLKEQISFVKKLASNYSGKQFMFCYYGFDLLGLFFMYELRKRNEVFFKNKDHFFEEKGILFLLRNTRLLKDYLLLLFMYWKFFSYFLIGGDRGFFGLPIKRLERDFKQLPPIQGDNFENNLTYFSDIYNIPKDAVIFIDQGNLAFEVGEEVIQYLKSNFDTNKIFIKEHPNFNLSNSNLSNYKIIPREVPLDLIINKSNILIGFYSTVLLDADVKLKLSLIELIKWKSNEQRLKYLSILKQNKNIYLISKDEKNT